ncbi:zinc finger protein-like protein RTS2 [Massarina eburnea CBS 473.64]|uniref:Zinc finger protein-like protein RTS2 n=1 Tax=Massarina eburnea CBS 473.64 TaxID=1395130 RepID=A0A6A6RUJ5_9PLEO|nr:zinc finger protein-like protein RTS2 [Massarina eburnea CBS 473.64]
MGRAEIGSTKHLANQMKSKGLQRLRWWCEICAKQCRDANGFKCHTQSESHVRQMGVVGENPQKYIQGFSTDFQRDFVALLRTAHGEKYISSNRFYNEYIRDKEHVHMNATKWASLTEFVKHLGREGIVNVKEDEKDGLCIAWRDTSAAAVQRREEIRELELAEARGGAGEEKMLKKMARRAQEQAGEKERVLEARKAAQELKGGQKEQKDSVSPLAEEKEVSAEEKEAPTNGEKVEEAPKVEAAPVKVSFGLKAKSAPAKPGLGQMKSQSVFKRARAENGEEKPKKKVKL